MFVVDRVIMLRVEKEIICFTDLPLVVVFVEFRIIYLCIT